MPFIVFRYAVITFSICCLVFALVPSLRNKLRVALVPTKVEVLSTLKSDYFKDGRSIVFAKIKTPEGLFIEIYESALEGTQNKLGRVQLPDQNDGYFHYRGQATNLALEDVNGDGRPEILAPSFDANHVAHLNVYTYNSDTEQFEPLPPTASDY